ncbi:MAG: DUF58 domain-containing protein [Planctomycetes bacterium]|nr:DUF58 domain-containing protein [Planctomycetota bacterium]
MKSTIKHQPSTINICFGLTDAGRVILRGTVFVALAALLIPTFGILSVLVFVMLVALVVGFIFRPRMQVTGTLPERVAAGQVTHLTYTIRNVGRLPAYGVFVRFRTLPEAIEQVAEAEPVRRLEPGATTELTVAIRPKRRGRYAIRPPACESSFPFNLFSFGTLRQEEESLMVLPAFSLLDLWLPYVSRHVSAGSVRPAGRVGTSPEYIGNRPFLPGDSPRHIDVRAWARLSVPATKEYDDDLDTYAALILDTRGPQRGRRSKAKDLKELEAAVSLCASVAYTIHRDCQIELLLAGRELYSFGSGPKATRLDRVHETLATVEPVPGYAADQIGPLLEGRLDEISEAVFILQSWDSTYQPLIELAEQAGCHCTVIIVTGSERTEAGAGSRPEAVLHRSVTAASDRGLASVIGPAADVQFVAADEILSGRRDWL